MHGVKTYGINRKEALSRDWKELNKETYVCLQNNVKVYFCIQIQSNKTVYIYLGAIQN